MENIYFITSNENKVKEAEAILNKKLERINLDVEEIQALEVEEVVKHKAKKAYQIIKNTVLVEDTGFYIEAWNNFPGALIKWMLRSLGNKGICKALQDKNRKVTVKTCYCLYDGKKFHIFIGQLKGKMPKKPRGKTNFGWDPIFIPENSKKTFAEMSAEEKNKISMRKLALEKLRKFLE
ncbi:MAG: RdgB/HAM1 family non-canonical purine NTP pyrophosphatase [Candidatus Nanoarchaeia archaeon]|nr:RdgB/HAM1 family non-canonical purine NTP pyrophosphatase [Candidatus Nanoarchaeia archaeon]MDD5740366.1 RdgB/HAM1 family non-canonical purine NTP pyrophosphatase [Candidatus Nanoarchaeia archaeon]